jgi:molecular chaperone DnaK (HSP70)
VALLEAITNPMQKIKLTGYLNEMANQRIDEKTKAIEAANQNNQETAERITKKQEASNQMSSLFSLLEELLREQGIQTTPNDKYRTRAVIVSNILANPLLFAKFDQETITLLRNIETSLYNGKNPFAYMSKEGKKKLQSLLKS